MTISKYLIDKDRGYIKKYIPRKNFESELSASRAAYSIAKASGLFYVPRILDFNDEESWVGFEYLPTLLPLSHYLDSREPQLFTLIEQVGVILSIVHQNLQIDKRIPLPEIFDCEGQHVFIHGDFNLTNVQYDISGKRIVVIDWSLSPLVKKPANWGVFYFDIAWMVDAIFYSVPWLRFDYQFRKQLAEKFLYSYINSSTYTFCSEHFCRLGRDLYWYLLKIFCKQERLLDFILQFYNRNYFPFYLQHFRTQKLIRQKGI